jgi:predicted ribosome quality control (RQC) complex YloA/Tae2 family protein
MNAIHITCLLREIEGMIVGRRVVTIAQSAADVVLVKLERLHETVVLDAGVDAPRIGWEPVRLPSGASRFSASAFTRLAGAVVANLSQPQGDRWVQIAFDNGWRLAWENLGRRANIALLDDAGVIVFCVRQYASGDGVTRAVVIGAPYPPAPDGAQPNPIANPDADETRADLGLGAGVFPPGAVAALRAGRGRPHVVYASDGPARLVAFRPETAQLEAAGLHGTRVESFATFAQAGAAWAAAVRERAARTRLLGALRAHWRERERHARRALAAVERDLAWADRFGDYRRYAEALVAGFGRMRRGAAEAHVPDPADPRTTLVIPLDPTKSPEENADRYFRDAKRGERGRAGLVARREELRAAATLAAEHLERWERASRESDSADPASAAARGASLREAAIEAGLLAPDAVVAGDEQRRGPAEKTKPKPKRDPLHGARVHRFEVTGGFTVLVGRTSADNDVLTHRVAKPWDLWFHSGQSSGSHVILVRGSAKANPPKEALLEAATLAAHFSKARNAGLVPVIYTEKRFVRKPRKSPPGLASCEREKTLFVRPKLLEEKRAQDPVD